MKAQASGQSQQRRMSDGVGVVLHDMCQPLTVLRCRLELGLLFGEPESMREALQESLEACLKLSGSVDRMRSLVERTDAEGSDGSASSESEGR